MGREGPKGRLAKAAGAEPSGQMRSEQFARRCEVGTLKNWTPLWRTSQNAKTHHCQTTFGSWDVRNSGKASIFVCSLDVRAPL